MAVRLASLAAGTNAPNIAALFSSETSTEEEKENFVGISDDRAHWPDEYATPRSISIPLIKQKKPVHQGNEKENLNRCFFKQAYSYWFEPETRIRLSQRNDQNYQYIGKVYMGVDKQEVSVVFDTGSDWLIVQIDDCATCNEETYD